MIKFLRFGEVAVDKLEVPGFIDSVPCRGESTTVCHIVDQADCGGHDAG
jgi:hypothetical protein